MASSTDDFTLIDHPPSPAQDDSFELITSPNQLIVLSETEDDSASVVSSEEGVAELVQVTLPTVTPSTTATPSTEQESLESINAKEFGPQNKLIRSGDVTLYVAALWILLSRKYAEGMAHVNRLSIRTKTVSLLGAGILSLVVLIWGITAKRGIPPIPAFVGQPQTMTPPQANTESTSATSTTVLTMTRTSFTPRELTGPATPTNLTKTFNKNLDKIQNTTATIIPAYCSWSWWNSTARNSSGSKKFITLPTIRAKPPSSQVLKSIQPIRTCRVKKSQCPNTTRLLHSRIPSFPKSLAAFKSFINRTCSLPSFNPSTLGTCARTVVKNTSQQSLILLPKPSTSLERIAKSVRGLTVRSVTDLKSLVSGVCSSSTALSLTSSKSLSPIDPSAKCPRVLVKSTRSLTRPSKNSISPIDMTATCPRITRLKSRALTLLNHCETGLTRVMKTMKSLTLKPSPNPPSPTHPKNPSPPKIPINTPTCPSTPRREKPTSLTEILHCTRFFPLTPLKNYTLPTFPTFKTIFESLPMSFPTYTYTSLFTTLATHQWDVCPVGGRKAVARAEKLLLDMGRPVYTAILEALRWPELTLYNTCPVDKNSTTVLLLDMSPPRLYISSFMGSLSGSAGAVVGLQGMCTANDYDSAFLRKTGVKVRKLWETAEKKGKRVWNTVLKEVKTRMAKNGGKKKWVGFKNVVEKGYKKGAKKASRKSTHREAKKGSGRGLRRGLKHIG
ncbi:hypothetical protein HDU79_008474 [Rhizoclosmatium sp. JEL0117]|nr:hypothetical protein HDU79_008474 [Rhizoclosmatium sp. JEL0117]